MALTTLSRPSAARRYRLRTVPDGVGAPSPHTMHSVWPSRIGDAAVLVAGDSTGDATLVLRFTGAHGWE